jgi:1,2-diacylglycerol 3-beta-glucosyltransferase
MQSLDWVLLFAAAAGTIRLGFPVTAMGNNFSIRRSTYDSVGGYESLPFSVTEDYALFHAVAGKGEYSIRLPVDPETMVLSDPCDTWDQLFRQKQRWFLGGRDMKGKYIAGYAIPFLFHLVLLVSLIVHPALGLITLAVKTCADVLLSLPMLMRLRQWGLLRYFPLVEAYLVCYTVILPLAVMFGGQTVWKGQILRNKPAAKSKAP